MSLIPSTMYVNDSTANQTKWNMFQGQVSNGVEALRLAYNRATGHSSDYKPVQNFIEQWAAPAAHDAKETVTNWLNGDSKSAEFTRNAIDGVTSLLSPSSASTTGGSYSSVRPAQHSGATINYMNADLAKHYGMDAKAAYSEALQNTAYQRAVSDLKAAGLNPVLAAGAVSPAGSFAAGNTLAGASGSGSSGGYRSGNSGEYAFSSDQYNLLGIIGTVAGGIAGAKLSPKAPVLGASTGMLVGKQLTQSFAQGLSSYQNLKK